MERSLVFNWHKVSKSHNIVLFFIPPGEDIEVGNDKCYMAWKVIPVPRGYGSAHVRFSESLGFGQCLITPDGMVFTSDWAETKRGEAVELFPPSKEQSFSVWKKSSVRNTDRCHTQVYNGTDQTQNIVLGTVQSIGAHNIRLLEPTFLWRAVKPKRAVDANFFPTLCAIVTDEYTESQAITNSIAPEQIIWRQNLKELDAATYWEFRECDEGFTIRKGE